MRATGELGRKFEASSLSKISHHSDVLKQREQQLQSALHGSALTVCGHEGTSGIESTRTFVNARATKSAPAGSLLPAL